MTSVNQEISSSIPIKKDALLAMKILLHEFIHEAKLKIKDNLINKISLVSCL
jgi:hypothetical protein